MAVLPVADANGYKPVYIRPMLHSGDTADNAYRRTVRDMLTGQLLGDYNALTVPTSFDVTLSPGNSRSQIEQAINNPNNFAIGFAPGDYTGLGVININRESASPVFLMPTDGLSTHPYFLSTGNKAVFRSFFTVKSKNIVFYRLALDGGQIETNEGRCFRFMADETGGTEDIVISHCDITNAKKTVYTKPGGGNNHWRTVIQYCTAHDAQLIIGVDSGAMEINGNRDAWISSNEIWDPSDDPLHHQNLCSGIRSENNDLYFTNKLRAKGDGTFYPGTGDVNEYPYLHGENHYDVKAWGALDNPILIFRNRMWHRFPTPAQSTGSGSSGTTSTIVHDGKQVWGGRYVAWVENYIESQRSFQFPNAAVGVPHYNAWVKNLFVLRSFHDPDNLYNATEMGRVCSFRKGYSTQCLFNTFVALPGEHANSVPRGGIQRANAQDIQANVLINCGAQAGSSSGRVDYNVYVNTPHMGDTNRLEYPNEDAAGLVDYSFYRKLITGPELYTVPKCRPSASSPIKNFAAPANHLSGYGPMDNGVTQAPYIP